MQKTLNILLKEEREKVIKEVETFCPLADLDEYLKRVVPEGKKCSCPYHLLSEQLRDKTYD